MVALHDPGSYSCHPPVGRLSLCAGEVRAEPSIRQLLEKCALTLTLALTCSYEGELFHHSLYWAQLPVSPMLLRIE